MVIGKIQQITVNEFLPALGISKSDVQNFDSKTGSKDIAVEFMIAYRFGHDIILNDIGTFKTQKIFDGEKFFSIASADGSSDPSGVTAKMDSLMKNVVNNKAGNLDGRFSDALRNTLFGSFGEDLGTRNMFRSLELGMMGYEALAECYGVPPDSQVRFAPLSRCCRLSDRRSVNGPPHRRAHADGALQQVCARRQSHAGAAA